MDIRKRSVLIWLSLSLILVMLHLTSFAVAQEPAEGKDADPTAAEQAQDTPPPALPDPWYKTPAKNNLVLSLGGAIWPSLSDKEFGPTSATGLPGSLNSLGLAFQVAYERHIIHWQRGDLYLGAEFGGFRFDNDKEDDTQPTTETVAKGALDSFAWYAGPSIKFMIGEGRVKFFVGGGGGYYSLKLTETDVFTRPLCTSVLPTCGTTKRSLTKSAMGGHVSFGLDLAVFQTQSGWQWRLRLEDDIHLVNYGSLDHFAPGVGGLSGPLNVIQFSVMAGF
jgi:hypothetical protein